ncbi:hypothetical protein CBS115989_7573 [Aspergillus niger]|nr:hypothetical protein CBS115989_7573 [Aspergillus niger]KAI2825678.1 hypothetical protein CBS133816_8223 [Aspergillus niger]KAI2838356.1 hypothetical protein CBS11232_9650 [Aspergillus niger]KAI2839642.1 hypothetical protein CBS11350_7473 [Aspergillus niger]KAI2869691.1 hypothetical protein CBS115988_9837 [Aspergillus niger]
MHSQRLLGETEPWVHSLEFSERQRSCSLAGQHTFEGVALCALFLATQHVAAENSMGGVLPTGSKNFLSRWSVVLLVGGEEVDLDTFSVVCISQKDIALSTFCVCLVDVHGVNWARRLDSAITQSVVMR